MKALNENYGPTEFQNPDEFLGWIRQTGSVLEYRQDFAKRAVRVKNWPEHCLLGVFLNGLKDDLKANVRVHKPRSVYKAMSLALEFEQKLGFTKGPKSASTWPNFRRPNMSFSQSSTSFTQPIRGNHLGSQ